MGTVAEFQRQLLLGNLTVHVAFLPYRFDISGLNRFASEIIDGAGQPISYQIAVDFGKLDFIDGCGLTVLENTLAWLFSFNVSIEFRNYNRTSSLAIVYLDDCGFFKKYLNGNLKSTAKVRDTTLPCNNFKIEFRHSWLHNSFVPWMAGTMRLEERAFDTLKNCLSEIFNNIVDHSLKNSGFVHVQHYPKIKRINITVSDFGQGIPNAIRSRYGEMDDATAIEYAMNEGVSSQTVPTNRGMGLSILLRTAILNRMGLVIQSYRGRMTCNIDAQGKVTSHKLNFDSFYPGTLIEFGFNTADFVGDEITEQDLEW
jgi:anti-sigma regulatory factor (Ser/Thr protein kinase)